MPKTAFLRFRISPDLKQQLEIIADREARSISQICEVLLRGGVAVYKRYGPKYLQELFSQEDFPRE